MTGSGLAPGHRVRVRATGQLAVAAAAASAAAPRGRGRLRRPYHRCVVSASKRLPVAASCLVPAPRWPLALVPARQAARLWPWALQHTTLTLVQVPGEAICPAVREVKLDQATAMTVEEIITITTVLLLLDNIPTAAATPQPPLRRLPW